MAAYFDDVPRREALCNIAKDFHGRGWMVGTGGNLSARERPNDESDRFWITGSGLPKGRLDDRDFLSVDVASGEVTEGSLTLKPSVETALHRMLYQRFPKANAVFHVHSVDSCLVAQNRVKGNSTIALPALEILKVFGISEQTPEIELPVFNNHPDTLKIAEEFGWRFKSKNPDLPALMIRDHGVTVWGESLQQAYHYIELMEFIFQYMSRSA